MILSQGTDGAVGGGRVEQTASVAVVPAVLGSHHSHAVDSSVSQESAERRALQQVVCQLSFFFFLILHIRLEEGS